MGQRQASMDHATASTGPPLHENGQTARPGISVDLQSDLSLDLVNDLHSWRLIVLLGVQFQSPVGALAERLAQLFAGDEPKLGGGRVAQP
jgi:hypothetical protein